MPDPFDVIRRRHILQVIRDVDSVRGLFHWESMHQSGVWTYNQCPSSPVVDIAICLRKRL